MKKAFTILLCFAFAAVMLIGCAPAAAPAATAAPAPAATAAPAATEAPAATPEKPLKIAFFVSDLTNVFHQQQVEVAKKYAKEKYNAEVYAFDGKADGNVMTQNIDQILAQGMDMATLHIWDAEAAKPGVLAAIEKGVTMASFFSPLPGSDIPTVRSDEAGVAKEMGKQMAEQWKKAYPDKPIVMVQLGWPNHTEVKSGRTDPFAEGVKSVDPSATDLGCLDASKGQDAAKQIVTDLCTQHPEVNLIFSESSNLTVGVMAALTQAGRGKFKDGKPLTEIVCSVDFDPVELPLLYDPNCSLKCSMGLPPIETAQARIDNLFAIRNGQIKQQETPVNVTFAKAYTISFWTMTKDEAVAWLKQQFNVEIK